MSNYMTDLERLTGWFNLTEKSFGSICQYIYWAQISRIDLKFTPSEKVNKFCAANGDAKLYTVSYGVPSLWELGAFEFLN